MSVLPKAIERLIEQFQRLPGIGPKTASRLSLYLLNVPQLQLESLANALSGLKKSIVFCSVCCNIAETDPCGICQSQNRNFEMICVVESPVDVCQIEKTGKYKGIYHVLHGAINPLNNIGPDEIRINELIKRLEKGTVKELILATNPNMEGEATSMYIKKELDGFHKNGLLITRLAHGLPVGADLEYADEVTLSRAFEGRREY